MDNKSTSHEQKQAFESLNISTSRYGGGGGGGGWGVSIVNTL